MRRVASLLAASCAAILLASCGYKLSGANTFLPERIKIIAVAPFENATNRPEIEQRVTEETSRELSKRGGYRVVADRGEAQALLEGSIAAFRTDPVQFNEQGRATRVQVTVSIRASLRDLASGDLLWSQSDLLFRQQFDVPETEAAFFDQETLALDDIARGAAGALVTSIFEGF